MINGVQSTTNVSDTYGFSSNKARGVGAVDNGFMHLLINQMKYQDPLSPMKDGEFLSQLTQFSILEQIQSLNNNATSISLIGKYVIGRLPDGQEITGIVDSVRLSGYPSVTVDGKEIPMDWVSEVVNREA